MLAGAAAVTLGIGGASRRGLAAAPPDRLTLWGGLVFPLVVLTALVAAALARGERLRARRRGLAGGGGGAAM